MILLALSLFFAFKILVRGERHYFLYYLIQLFAFYSLPSEVGEYFVLRFGELMVSGRDLFLLTMFVYFVTNESAKRYIVKNWKLASILVIYIVLDTLKILYSWHSFGMNTTYLRGDFFSLLFLCVCVIEFDVLKQRASLRLLDYFFNGFCLVTLLSAVLAVGFPELNVRSSELYSSIGWAVDTGSMVYITVIAGDVCLVAIYYFLFIRGRFVLHPSILLPVALVIAGSHRITYVALGLLFCIYYGQGAVAGLLSRFKKRAVVDFFLAVGVGTIGFAVISQTEFFASAIAPFVGRLLSLGDPQNLTIVERTYQYSYFFTSYLPGSDVTKILFGENYLPIALRDKFYLTVNPHNFLIGTVLTKGFIGLVLSLSLLVGAVFRGNLRMRTPFIIALLLFLLTQMTDAAFSEFPFTALYALLLSLILANSTMRVSREPEETDTRKS